uniref:Uncharacterized protein n=1 Tax=Glossina brevipalpis TaxID=37001 RepID=A0A1A9W122_9MUSC
MPIPNKSFLDHVAAESSDDDYTSLRSNALAPLHGHYPVYVLPSDHHNVDDLRVASEDTSAKIKKNFDEIDKTSASFSTLNQLL